MRKKLFYPLLSLLIILSLVVSLAPDFYRLAISPKGITFPLVHNSHPDYYYYLSFMKQGSEGNLLLTSRTTPERFKPVLAQTFYAVLGIISRVGNISNVFVYFFSRIIFGALLLVSCIYLACQLFKSKREILLSLLFVSFGAGFWTVILKDNQVKIDQFLMFWSRMDPIMRTTYLPHHLLSTIIAIFSLVLLAKALEQNNIAKAVFAGILGFLSGFIYFATMLNILGALAVFTVIWTVYTLYHKNWEISRYLCLVYYALLSSLSLLYVYYLSISLFPWSSYNRVGEIFIFQMTVFEYLGNLGPLIILVILGLRLLLQQKSTLSLLLLSWLIFPTLGIFLIAPYFPRYGNVYFLEATSYIPVGILAVFGVKMLDNRLGKKYRFVVPILIFFLFLYFIPPIYGSYQREFPLYSTTHYNVYLPNGLLDSFSWLEKNTPKESVVLAGGYIGNLIPAFTHNRVVYGHPANTFAASQKISDAYVVFNQTNLEEARVVLVKYNVSYVFFSLDTNAPGENFVHALNLTKVYENDKVKIFRRIL